MDYNYIIVGIDLKKNKAPHLALQLSTENL